MIEWIFSVFLSFLKKEKEPSYIRIPRNRCIQTKKKNPFLSITLSVVARRKGRHQQKKKKNSIFSLAQCSGKPWVAPPTKKKKPVRLIELTSPKFLEEPGYYPSSKFKPILLFFRYIQGISNKVETKRNTSVPRTPKENRKRRRANQSISVQKIKLILYFTHLSQSTALEELHNQEEWFSNWRLQGQELKATWQDR